MASDMSPTLQTTLHYTSFSQTTKERENDEREDCPLKQSVHYLKALYLSLKCTVVCWKCIHLL